MLTHHTTQKARSQLATGLGVEAEMQKHLAGLHKLLDQQLQEIKLVAAIFDYTKFAGATGLQSGSFVHAAH